MSRLITYIRQSSRRRRLVLEAMAELARAWTLVRLRPFKTYSARLGVAAQGEAPEGPKVDIVLCSDVRWAVQAVNRSFGGHFTCLMQGMAGKAMLNRRGVANTLVLGARLKKDEDTPRKSDIAAHAWLYCGPVVLLGGEIRDEYVPVTSYVSP